MIFLVDLLMLYAMLSKEFYPSIEDLKKHFNNSKGMNQERNKAKAQNGIVYAKLTSPN